MGISIQVAAITLGGPPLADALDCIVYLEERLDIRLVGPVSVDLWQGFRMSSYRASLHGSRLRSANVAELANVAFVNLLLAVVDNRIMRSDDSWLDIFQCFEHNLKSKMRM